MATGFLSKINIFRRKHPVIANLIYIAITACIVLWLILMFLDMWTHHGEDSTVPEIKNLPYAEAKSLLESNDLVIEISDSIYDRNTAPGTVIESWPHAGAVVKRGRQVYVTITSFSPKQVSVAMPVSGVSLRQASSYLQALGITSLRIVEVPSQYAGLVERATYDGGKTINTGTLLPVTAAVTLEVGSGPIAEPDSIDTDSTAPDYEALDRVINEIEDL